MKQVSHIEVEQELVTMPPVKTPAASGAAEPHPLQLLLVPSGGAPNSGSNATSAASRLAGGAHRRPPTSGAETVRPLDNHVEPSSAASAGSVSVGVAVQVPASSYVPAKAPARRPLPPPVPPRNVRLALSYSACSESAGAKPMQRPYREPPLLEETDSADGSRANEAPPPHRSVQSKAAPAASASSHDDDDDDDSDAENSRSGMMACVSNANDTSIESLVQEETALLLPAATSGRGLIRTALERDENTLI